MNYGPLVFLAAFFALASSWFGFVVTPQLQLGQMQQTNTVPAGALYPVARPGMAQQGLQVYRANGCAYCHSQQVVQTGTVFDLLLTDAGTNQAAFVAALQMVLPRLSRPEALEFAQGLPKPVRRGVAKVEAEAAAKTLKAAGATTAVWIVPVGPDIARGWGRRRTVAEDFLFDSPVQPGIQRIGPDLANVGVRQPDAGWHLRHLYAPKAVVAGSIMPPYPYLFEKRKAGRQPSPDALLLPHGVEVEAGYEIVPKPEAKALAAYLVSLRAGAPLFSAPLSVAAAPVVAQTNAPAGTTNAPAAGPNATTNSAPGSNP
ncbi:MAG TPA: ribosomal protein L7/L12 [Clostridia bacterium]|nr:ribosomal protein L7/L12 [Clostridia bacterium]